MLKVGDIVRVIPNTSYIGNYHHGAICRVMGRGFMQNTWDLLILHHEKPRYITDRMHYIMNGLEIIELTRLEKVLYGID